MKERVAEVLKKGSIFFGIGFVYLILYKNDIFQLHCPIRSLTGFLCPGCGISQMVCALSDLDFNSAWQYNPAAFICLPVLIVVLVQIAYKYVLSGSIEMSKVKKSVLWGIVAVLCIYGIMRNLPLNITIT